MSPTEKTLKWMRENGYFATVVERWNSFAGLRQDLFGIVDVVGLRKGETLAVQATSKSNVSARVRKITDHKSTPKLREAGWRILVMGWEKGSNDPRIVDIS